MSRKLWFFSWLAFAAVVCGVLVPFNSVEDAIAQPSSGFASAVFKKKPTPIIVGVAEVGSWLTVVIGAWDAGTKLGIQWTRNGSDDIKGQNKSRYLVTSADVGQRLTVSVTGQKKGYLVHKATSAEVIPFAKGTKPSPTSSGKPSTNPSPNPSPTAALGKLVNTPIPTIVGNPVVGAELQALAGNWDSGVQISYQWFRGSAPILGATGAKYVVVGQDSGSALKVVTTGSKAIFASVERSSAPTRVVTVGTGVLQDIPVSSRPLIRGNTQVGQSLVLEAGNWSNGISLTIQWLRNGAPISGASSMTYKLTPLDLLAKISVSVTGSMAGFKSLALVSDLTPEVIAATFSETGTPELTGSTSVGSTLTLSTGLWDKAAQLAIKWMVDGVAIAGQTGASYILRAGDLGKTVSASITATAPGYRSENKSVSTAATVTSGSIDVAPTPIISGTSSVGSILTANPGVWASGVSLAYQWQKDGASIPGATSATYKILASDMGAILSVVVTGSKVGFQSLTKTGTFTGQIPSSVFPNSPPPTIIWLNGRNYSLDASLDWGADTQFTFQWFRNNVVIVGANSQNYSASPEDSGQSLTLIVTGTKPGFQSVSRVSTPIVVPHLTFSKFSVGICCTYEVDKVLSALASWDAGANLQYQWTRDGTAIPGATSSSYRIATADAGRTIGLVITGSKLGYLTKTVAAAGLQVKEILRLTPNPTISGALTYHSTLVAEPGTWDDGVTFSYQWYKRDSFSDVNVKPVGLNGLSKSFSPNGTLSGSYFWVCVTGTKAGLAAVTKCSETVRVQNDVFPNQPPLVILGDRKFNSTLSVDTSGWISEVRIDYTWVVAGGIRIGTGQSDPYGATFLLAGDTWRLLSNSTLKLNLRISKDGYETVTQAAEISFPPLN